MAAVAIREVERPRGGVLRSILKRRVARAEIARMYRNLSILLDSGLTLMRALDGLIDQASSPGLVEALDSVRASVEAGSSLHEAMERHEHVFGTFAVRMVKAAERSGQLSSALLTVADYEDRMVQMRGKITRALIYPSIVLGAAVAEMFLVSLILLPRLADLITGAGVKMPVFTVAMIAASRFLLRMWWAVLALFVSAAFAFTWWVRTPSGRWRFHGFLWRFPVVGPVVRRLSIARLCLATSSLLKSGVSVQEALLLAAPISGNALVENAVTVVQQRVVAGTRLSDAVRREKALPPLMAMLIAVGEESGTLDQMLRQVADISEQEAWPMVESAIGMLEPLVIMVVGVMVLFIALSVWGSLAGLMDAVEAAR
jgi:type II secretory pathway component PulF